MRLEPGAQFHFHHGVVKHDDILGSDEGVQILTALGHVVSIYRPRLCDYVVEMPRTSAVISPKDIAVILMWADIYPGARVFESGVGSGALTTAILRAIGPTGSLVSYEHRSEMMERASQNVAAFLGATPNWTMVCRDAYLGISDGPFERMVLDLPDPAKMAFHADAALAPGGIVSWFVPNVDQMQTSVAAFRASGKFSSIESVETLVRPWEFHGRTARPSWTMTNHTGFLAFARKGPIAVSATDSDSATS